MIFLHPVHRFSTDELVGYKVLCPGCKRRHFYMIQEFDGHPFWDYSGDMEKPTFTPSLRATYINEEGEQCCHFYLTDGIFEFQNDCTHNLSGQKHSMIEYKPEY